MSDRQYAQLRQLTGTRDTPAIAFTSHNDLSLVNFTRPELSPILAVVRNRSAAEYQEALAIIRAGAEQLARQPREDMLGPQAGPVLPADLQRMERLKALENADSHLHPGRPRE